MANRVNTKYGDQRREKTHVWTRVKEKHFLKTQAALKGGLLHTTVRDVHLFTCCDGSHSSEVQNTFSEDLSDIRPAYINALSIHFVNLTVISPYFCFFLRWACFWGSNSERNTAYKTGTAKRTHEICHSSAFQKSCKSIAGDPFM